MAWTKYKSIQYAADGIPGENLTDFPKLVSITADADIASELSGGGGIKSASADGLTDLSFGLYPSTDLANGTILARVKLTLLTAASGGDVICRLYYSSSESTTEDKAGTVSNSYVLFMPLEEDPSGSAPQMYDWVSETNVGTSAGGMTSDDLVTGQVGNGLQLDSSDSVGVGDHRASFTQDVTVEAAVSFTAAGSYPMVFSAARTDGEDREGFELRLNASTGRPSFSVDEGSGRPEAIGSTSIVGAGLVALAGVRNGASIKVFRGGASVGTATASGNIAFGPSGSDWKIGARGTVGGFNAAALIDELRLSNVARSDNWLAFAYADDFDNADTFSLGTEQGGGGNNELVALESGMLTGGFSVLSGGLA